MGEFVAGCVSGMVGLAVGHPVDTVKVQQQNEGIGMLKCVKNIYNVDGFRGYFRGLSFPLVCSGALNSIFFGIYGTTLNYIVEHKQYQQHVHAKFASESYASHSKNEDRATYVDIYLAGCAGGVAQVGLACPIDLIKVKLQAHGFRVGSPTECVREILKKQGVRGLYQGIGIMAIRDIPAFGLYVAMYEFLMDQLRGINLQINLSGTTTAHLSNSALAFLAGGFAGTISWLSILPQDVIKSRIQADNPNCPKYKGIMDCAEIILKEHGPRGFFRGFWPLSIRAFTTNGAIFVTYEWLQLMWTFVTKKKFNSV